MDWVISDELTVTIGNVMGWVSAGAMIVGGFVPYIPQYHQIRSSQDSEGFSLYVCLTLLVANTLRIFFWFGKRFEYPLLIQSFIMNVAMFIMIHLCIQVRNKNKLVQARSRVFSELDSKYFWAWTDFQSYVDCMVVFAIVCAITMYFMISVNWFIELVGFLAVFTEAMLGVPQLLRNYKNRSTLGMSVTMVCMWTCGDIFKTVYFLIREAPPQFWICGALQILVDLAIILQVYCYRHERELKRPTVHRLD